MRVALILRGEHSRAAAKSSRNQPSRQATSVLDIWPNIQKTIIQPLLATDNTCDTYFVTYDSNMVDKIREVCQPKRIDIHPKVSQIENFAFVVDLMQRTRDQYDRFIVARCDIRYRLRINDWPNWGRHGIILVGRDRCWPSKRLYDDHLFIVDSNSVDVFQQAFRFRQWPEEDLHGMGRYLYLHYHQFHLMYDEYYSCFNAPPHPLLMQAGIEPEIPDLDHPVTGRVMEIKAFNDTLCYCSKTPCICRVPDEYYSILKLLQFDFHQGLDSINGDIKYIGGQSVNLLKLQCIREPLCVGFNTLGFFKNKISALTPSPYYQIGDGFYINRLRYRLQQMLDGDSNYQLLNNQSSKMLYQLAFECNSILALDNIGYTLLQGLTDKQVYSNSEFVDTRVSSCSLMPCIDLCYLDTLQLPKYFEVANRYLVIKSNIDDYASGEWHIIADQLQKHPDWHFYSSCYMGDGLRMIVLECDKSAARLYRPLRDRRVIVGSFASEGPPCDDGLPFGYLLDKYCQILKMGGADVVNKYTPQRIHEMGGDWAVHHYQNLPMRYNIGYHTTGLGAWRAFIFRDLFLQASNGDVVVLHDPNYEKYPGYLDVAQNIRTFALRCAWISESTGGLYMPMHLSQYSVGTYTRSCLFDILNIDKSVAHLPIGRMRCTIFVVSDATRALVEDFYQTCHQYRANILADNCQCTTPHKLGLEGIHFSHNTAEQSVFNLLAYRHGLFGTKGDEWNFRYRGHGEHNDRKYLTEVLDFD